MLPIINKEYSISSGHCQLKTKDEIKTSLKTYRDNLDANETKSCLLPLKEIKFLIDYYSDAKNLKGKKPN